MVASRDRRPAALAARYADRPVLLDLDAWAGSDCGSPFRPKGSPGTASFQDGLAPPFGPKLLDRLDRDVVDRLLPAFDSGDHLHPNEKGYAAMADGVDLSLFDDLPCR